MKNQQIQQNQQNKNPYEALDKLGKDIVNLKLSGLRYEHIVAYLDRLGEKRENQTVREWFIEGGKYYEAYKYMKEKKQEVVNRCCICTGTISCQRRKIYHPCSIRKESGNYYELHY